VQVLPVSNVANFQLWAVGARAEAAASPRCGALVCAGEFARAFLWGVGGAFYSRQDGGSPCFWVGAPSNRCSKAASALHRRKQQGRGRPCHIARRNWRSPRRGAPTRRPRQARPLPLGSHVSCPPAGLGSQVSCPRAGSHLASGEMARLEKVRFFHDIVARR